jgi:NADPH:quinone reductase-like Zn-dependent oxidoreductase
MLYSPINPSDLYLALGVYGYRPKLPVTLGFEGIGEIVDS